MTTVPQPLGRVTLVFTDIEGSTRLLGELGEVAYREALAEHRARMRAAFGAHGGYEVDSQGDSFFFAFASATSATRAIGEALAALEGGPIRIRVSWRGGDVWLGRPERHAAHRRVIPTGAAWPVRREGRSPSRAPTPSERA
jgi:class 3 adenylate cyclase